MKKIISILMTIIIMSGMFITAYAEDTDKNYAVTDISQLIGMGDVNGDRNVSASDARLVLRHSAKIKLLEETKISSADVDRNGKITAGDARTVLRVAAKLESFKPVEFNVATNVSYELGTLQSLSDAGYLWICSVPDENVIEVTGKFESSVDNTGKLPEEIIDGASVLQTFTVKANKPGRYEIIFEHKRPWNNELLDKFSFIMIVE